MCSSDLIKHKPTTIHAMMVDRYGNTNCVHHGVSSKEIFICVQIRAEIGSIILHD